MTEVAILLRAEKPTLDADRDTNLLTTKTALFTNDKDGILDYSLAASFDVQKNDTLDDQRNSKKLGEDLTMVLKWSIRRSRQYVRDARKPR